MKTEEFSRALNEIDDKYIEEARCYKMKKRFPVKRTIAAAACVALMIGTIPLVKHFNTPTGTGTTGGVVQGTTGGEDALPTVIKLGNKLTAYDMGPHAGGTSLGAENSVEFKAGNIEFFYDNAKDGDKKTIKINGKTYTGVYQTSIESPYYNDDTDVYNISENGKVVQHFEINRATGMLTNFQSKEELQYRLSVVLYLISKNQ